MRLWKGSRNFLVSDVLRSLRITHIPPNAHRRETLGLSAVLFMLSCEKPRGEGLAQLSQHLLHTIGGRLDEEAVKPPSLPLKGECLDGTAGKVVGDRGLSFIVRCHAVHAFVLTSGNAGEAKRVGVGAGGWAEVLVNGAGTTGAVADAALEIVEAGVGNIGVGSEVVGVDGAGEELRLVVVGEGEGHLTFRLDAQGLVVVIAEVEFVQIEAVAVALRMKRGT